MALTGRAQAEDGVIVPKFPSSYLDSIQLFSILKTHCEECDNYGRSYYVYYNHQVLYKQPNIPYQRLMFDNDADPGVTIIILSLEWTKVHYFSG